MNTRAITKNKKVVTFGEVMLRLTTPNFQRFSQTNEFIATYGGSEAKDVYKRQGFGYLNANNRSSNANANIGFRFYRGFNL